MVGEPPSPVAAALHVPVPASTHNPPLGYPAPQPTIAQIAVGLLAVIGTTTLPATLLDHACALFHAQRGTLTLVNQDGELVAMTHVTTDAVGMTASALDELRLTAHLLQRTIPLVVDCTNDPQARQTFCADGDCPFTFGFPLQWDGHQIAVLQLERTRGERHLCASDLGLLSQFADMAAAALVRHRALVRERGGAGATVELAHALHHAVSHSAQLSASLLANVAAVEQERQRIAYELHDGARPNLLGAQMQIEAARSDLRAGALDAALHQLDGAQRGLASTDAELARLVRALCPPQLSDDGLEAALLDLGLHWATTAQIAVTFDLADTPVSLSAPTQLALYRIVQEALTNICRHAGAHHVNISLQRHGAQLVLSVADDGCGGVGLFRLNERAHALGASLQIASPPGAGTRISVTLPLLT